MIACVYRLVRRDTFLHQVYLVRPRVESRRGGWLLAWMCVWKMDFRPSHLSGGVCVTAPRASFIAYFVVKCSSIAQSDKYINSHRLIQSWRHLFWYCFHVEYLIIYSSSLFKSFYHKILRDYHVLVTNSSTLQSTRLISPKHNSFHLSLLNWPRSYIINRN